MPVEIVIDPGQAFGTGAHATTRLCLELMLELPAPGPAAFLDLGCGSGVLAIAAARLGWDPVIALDYDPASVEAAVENARVNGVADRGAPARPARRPGGDRRRTVAANLLAAAAAGVGGAAGGGERPSAPGDRDRERPAASARRTRLRARSGRSGCDEAARRESGEWAALLLERRR